MFPYIYSLSISVLCFVLSFFSPVVSVPRFVFHFHFHFSFPENGARVCIGFVVRLNTLKKECAQMKKNERRKKELETR